MKNKFLTTAVVLIVVVAAFFAFNYAKDKFGSNSRDKYNYTFSQEKPDTFPEAISFDEDKTKAKEFWQDDTGRQGALFATDRSIEESVASYEESLLSSGWQIINKIVAEQSASLYAIKESESVMIDMIVLETPKGVLTQINVKYLQ